MFCWIMRNTTSQDIPKTTTSFPWISPPRINAHSDFKFHRILHFQNPKIFLSLSTPRFLPTHASRHLFHGYCIPRSCSGFLPPPWSFILTAVAQPSSALFSLAFPCFLVNCVNFSLCLPLPSLAHSQFSFLISRSYPLSFATFLPIFLSLPFDSSTFFPLSSTFFSFTPFSSSNSLRLLLFSSPTSLSLSLCSFPLLFPGRKPFLRFFLRFASGSFLF